jgi:hypothetical protein
MTRPTPGGGAERSGNLSGNSLDKHLSRAQRSRNGALALCEIRSHFPKNLERGRSIAVRSIAGLFVSRQ